MHIAIILQRSPELNNVWLSRKMMHDLDLPANVLPLSLAGELAGELALRDGLADMQTNFL